MAEEGAAAAREMSPQAVNLMVEVLRGQYAGQGSAATPDEETALTLADIVDVLEAVESEDGYEAARHFASYLDYAKLTEMTMAFTQGHDTNPENDPQLMPTRFMILYGADDAKLRQIDDHPDLFDGEEHQVNVANLRKALILLGYEIAETGPYDDEVLQAHFRYLAGVAAYGEAGEYDADEADAKEEDPLGYVIVRITDRRGQPLAKASCNLKNSSGTVGSAVTDRVGYVKWGDVPLDEYAIEVDGPEGRTTVYAPWLSSDSQAHTIMMKARKS